MMLAGKSYEGDTGHEGTEQSVEPEDHDQQNPTSDVVIQVSRKVFGQRIVVKLRPG
jgi:hypothetical protein